MRIKPGQFAELIKQLRSPTGTHGVPRGGQHRSPLVATERKVWTYFDGKQAIDITGPAIANDWKPKLVGEYEDYDSEVLAAACEDAPRERKKKKT